MRRMGRFLFALLLLLAFFFILDNSGIGFREKLRAAVDYVYGKLRAVQFLQLLTDSVQ